MREKQHKSITADLDNFRPMGDMVLVKRLPDPEESKGGILIPEMARNENRPKYPGASGRMGIVVASGPGDKGFEFRCSACGSISVLAPSLKAVPGAEEAHYRIVTKCNCGTGELIATGNHSRLPMYVSVGDKVLFQRWVNNVVVLNDEEYTLLHAESQVLAVIEEEVAA
jgi:co-chaperonin GroES (HSP10)